MKQHNRAQSRISEAKYDLWELRYWIADAREYIGVRGLKRIARRALRRLSKALIGEQQ